jgi:opacity protein-like surface antigen
MKKVVLGLGLAAIVCSPALAQSGTTTTTQKAPSTAASMPAGAPMPPYTFEPGPRQGDWEAALGANGASTDKFDANALGVEGSIGYYVLKMLPITLRQNAAFVFGSDFSDQWTLATRLFADYQYNNGNWFQPFIGVGFGGIYGRHVDQSLVFAPNAGAKMYVNESTFVQARFEWDWKFTADNNSDFEDGDALYTIGVGWNF